MALFKAYDIRGVVPDELDRETAYGIGRAVAHFSRRDPGDGAIAVGRDARVHSPELAGALVDGIRDEGVPVVAYDPAISESVGANRAAVDMWPFFDALAAIPLLVIRGETSDILAPACVTEMRRRRPDIDSAKVPKRGHAPMLNERAALSAIQSFLSRASGAVA